MASIKLLMSSTWVRSMVPRAKETQLLVRVQVNVNRSSVAGVCHKDRMDPVVKAIKPKPFPYKEKRITNWRFWFTNESTIDRFDENTVLVAIDGLPGSGKSAFAKKFAEMTDMYHQPRATFDTAYIRDDGLDYRIFNKIYFRDAQYPDIDMFLKDPKHPKMGRMQCEMYKLRFVNYLEAMIHLFNTGQGVVMERSPWSDQVFIEAMYKCGFTNHDHLRYYTYLKHNTQIKIWRPHLVIYIDTPVETAMKNIKKRNIPHEINSPIWNTEFLKHIDETYKTKILPQYDEHAYVLIYPYKDELDVDAILTDIEKMDFLVKLSDQKLCDWRIGDDVEFTEWRMDYTNNFQKYMAQFQLPTFDVDGYDYSNEAKQIQHQTERALVPSYWPNFDPNAQPWWKLAFKRDNKVWNERLVNLFRANFP